MRPRVLLVAAAGVALAVVAYAVLVPSGLPRSRELRAEERALASEVEQARAHNARLEREVKVLQGGEPSSAAVLEKLAREELGWVKRDELVLTGLPASWPGAPRPMSPSPSPSLSPSPSPSPPGPPAGASP